MFSIFKPAFLLTIYGLLGAFSAASAQAPELIPVQVSDLWGYCDRKREIQIPATFAEAKPFHRQIASVRQGDKWGLIDKNGDWVLQARYDFVSATSPHRLRIGKKYGLFTATNDMVAELKYDRIHPQQAGMHLVKIGDRYGMIDTTGKEVVPLKFDHIQILRDDDGKFTDLIQVQIGTEKGLYDRCGSRLQPPRFSRIHTYHDMFAVVQQGNKFGLLDLDGRIVVPLNYDQLHPVQSGMLAARIRNRWGFLDTKGQQAIPFNYEAVHEDGFFQGRAAAKVGANWHLIDRKGRILLSPQGELNCIGTISEGLASACKVDANGQMKFGFVDPDGKQVIAFEYDRVDAFSGGFAVVGQRLAREQTVIRKMKYGIINRDGKRIFPLTIPNKTQAVTKADSLSALGWVHFAQGDKNCKIDSKGTVFDCEYPRLRKIQNRFEKSRCESRTRIAVARGDLWGFSDPKGKLKISFRYASVECFSGGLARVSLPGEERYFYIDEKGREYRKVKERSGETTTGE